MASTQDPVSETLDRIAVRPLVKRLQYAAAAGALQTLVSAAAVKAYFSKPTESSPDLTKTYPVRPSLPISIFYPKSYNSTDASASPLPVFFTVHGGGFVLGSVADTNAWNRLFSTEHNCLVIGLNYAKAPANPYPGPTADIVALFTAILSDTSLPIDHSKIALGGWSAGGNLALSVAQHPEVRGAVKALVPIYPVTDFSIPPERKPASRRFKPELGGFRAKETDYLMSLAGLFDWAYCPAGGDAKDPGLSVGYVEREAVPKNVFMVGCEMDMLGHEGWRLAYKLGGKEMQGKVVGREGVGKRGELEVEDERFFWEVQQDDGGVVRWLLVPDVLHGFDMNLAGIGADEETLEDGRLKAEKMRTMIGDWLKANAWNE